MCNFLARTRSGEILLGINFSFEVGNIDLSCLDMRSVAGEKVVLLNGVFLYFCFRRFCFSEYAFAYLDIRI